MKWTVHGVLLVAVAACQSGKDVQPTPSTGDTKIIQLPKAQLTDAYKSDISNLCDAIRLAGAQDKPADERWTHVAMWLGPNIKTTEGHDFLVAIQPLRGEAKALALDTEAHRVGLAKCVLADEWRAAAAAPPAAN